MNIKEYIEANVTRAEMAELLDCEFHYSRRFSLVERLAKVRLQFVLLERVSNPDTGAASLIFGVYFSDTDKTYAFKIDGYTSSYYENDFDDVFDFYEVVPVNKTITVYERKT
jgi:hypothetical protein